MIFQNLGFLVLLAGVVTASPLDKRAGPDEALAKTAADNTLKVLAGTLKDGSDHSACTQANLIVRKEYGNLTNDEKDDYTSSVKCLMKLPSKLNPTQYPGAKSRYDDFVVVHMNMTPHVHSTANFLHWHRYYVFAYETALRTECGYKGYQPYWNWGKYADPTTSPIFNGDAHSMGGNGDYVAHSGAALIPGGSTVPAGKGGGCVTTGPFANMTVNLGPLMKTMDPKLPIPSNPRADGYGYNPRCLRRDVSSYFTSQFLRPVDIANHITSSTSQGTFQDTIQNDTPGKYTLHTSGHYTIWGDPGGDVYVSPAEPIFWLHHGQVDRHWWMWQNQDPVKRVQQYTGGTEWFTTNSPPGKITDVQWLDVVTPKSTPGGLQSKYLVSTTAGPFCYTYQ